MFPTQTRRFVLFALLLAACLSGCSKDLSRSNAASLIKRQADFSSPMGIRVPIGTFWWDYRNLEMDPERPLKALSDKGIIKLRETGQKEGWWEREYVTELTQRGKELSKSWQAAKEELPGTFLMASDCWTTWGHGEPCHQPDGVMYAAPLAHRELEEVTGIAAAGERNRISEAQFTWRWISTDTGKLFPDRVGSGLQNGEATLQLYDDGWRIVEIRFQ